MYEVSYAYKTGFVIALMQDERVLEFVFKPAPSPSDSKESRKEAVIVYKAERKALIAKKNALVASAPSGVFSIRAGTIRNVRGFKYFFPSLGSDKVKHTNRVHIVNKAIKVHGDFNDEH